MIYYLDEDSRYARVGSSDEFCMFWSCAHEKFEFVARKPEDVPKRVPYGYVWEDWLKLDGVKELRVRNNHPHDWGRIAITVVKEPGVDTEELLSRMYPKDDRLWQYWYRHTPVDDGMVYEK